jgi:hypothetical protein
MSEEDPTVLNPNPDRYNSPGLRESGVKEEYYGTSVGSREAYLEGYSSKYGEWSMEHRVNPYPEGTVEYDSWDDGYSEAVMFA